MRYQFSKHFGSVARRKPASRAGTRLFRLFLVLAVAGCSAPQIRTDLIEAERREDLAFLSAEFGARERSFTPETRRDFEARIAATEARVAAMSHDEFIMALQWAVAAADNGHSEALVHEHQRLRLPVDLHWFADGLYVVKVRPGHEDLLGAQVLAIEDTAPETLDSALAPYIGGNREHQRVISGLFLERPELLAGIGVSQRSDRLRLRLLLANGEEIDRDLAGLAGESTANAADGLALTDRLTPLPLYLRDPDEAAYLAWLPDIDAAYVRINQNVNRALPEKLERILRELEERRPRQVIVDLRLNGGGNYLLTAPFAEALPALIPADGRLVLVLGNQTFSAGIVTAAILKARAGESAVVVGERIGDGLTYWSEGDLLVLPNSGLRVHYSDGYHDWRDGYDGADPRYRFNPRVAAYNQRYSAAAGSLEPDIVAPLTFGDFLAGHDPAMEAIRRMR